MLARTQDPDAYQLKIENDELHPVIRNGWRIIVEPASEPRSGCLVVVETSDGNRMIKELLWHESGRVALDSITATPGRVTLSDDEIVTMHRIGDIALP